MPQRSKSSAKADSSQSDVASQKRKKRLRVYSDDDDDDVDDEGYEPHQERRTSYNESYTRGGTGGSSPPTQGKRQKASVPITSSPSDGEQSDYETPTRDYDDPREGEEEEDEEEMLAQDNTRSVGRGDTSTYMEDDGDDDDDDDDDGHMQQTAGGRNRKPSMKARQITAATATTKKSTTKGKQRVQSSNKRKRRQGDDSGDEEEYNDDYEDEEVNVDEVGEGDEDRFSDDYEEYEEEDQPVRGKKGRGAGRGKARDKVKVKDMVHKKAKFEGKPLTINSTITTASIKRPRTKKPTEEDAVVDIMDETGTPDPSSIGSPTATTVTEGGKDDTPASSGPPVKKRKLPTIKKLKSIGSSGGAGTGGTGTGPSTPSSIIAAGGKPPAPPPPSGVTGNGVNKLGITEASKARPKTNATTDLDLSNPSLYAELFKNPGGNASRTGLNRRAKEEERRKELDKMREEHKVKFAEESQKSFDLQGQAEKMARFEEVLRHRRSSALYPNFLAAKWREEWEREKRRAQRRDYQQQAQPNGHVDDTKEEGEM